MATSTKIIYFATIGIAVVWSRSLIPSAVSVDPRLSVNQNASFLHHKGNFSSSIRSLLEGMSTNLNKPYKHDPMTKNQISVPLGNGSIAGSVGSILVTLFFGLTIWLALLSYLGDASPVRRVNSEGKDSIINILADTVEKGMNEQYQKMYNHELSSLQRYDHNHYYQYPQDTRISPSQSENNEPQRLQNSWANYNLTRRIAEPDRITTGIRTPQSVYGNRIQDQQTPDQNGSIGGGTTPTRPIAPATSIRKETVDVVDRQPIHWSPPKDKDYNAYQIRPFSLSSSFVNPEAQRDDVTYYYEIPQRPQKLSEPPPKKEVTYYFELPPTVLPTRIKQKRPTVPPKKDVTYYFEIPPRMPTTTQDGFKRRIIFPSESDHMNRPAGYASHPDDRYRPSAIRKHDFAYRYEYPPPGILNPKPNKWKSPPGSRPSSVPFHNPNRRKGNVRFPTPGWSKIDTYRESLKKKIPEPGSSSELYPTTMTPGTDTSSIVTATPTTKIATAVTGVETEETNNKVLPSITRDAFDYDDVITAIRLKNGVPINWMPDIKKSESLHDEKDGN